MTTFAEKFKAFAETPVGGFVLATILIAIVMGFQSFLRYVATIWGF